MAAMVKVGREAGKLIAHRDQCSATLPSLVLRLRLLGRWNDEVLNAQHDRLQRPFDLGAVLVAEGLITAHELINRDARTTPAEGVGAPVG